MKRTFKIAGGEKVTPKNMVQVLENDSVADLPLIKKGITMKNTITNSYKKSKSNTNSSVKIDNNKIITAIDNTIYLSKYEDNELIELDKKELDSGTNGINNSKVIKINDNKVFIIYSTGVVGNGSISCYTWELDENNGINNFSDKFIITSNTGSSNIEATALYDNLIAFTYKTNLNQEVKNIEYSKNFPMLGLIELDGTKFSIPQPFIRITSLNVESSEEFKESEIDVEELYITKVSKDEFLETFTIRSDRNANVYSIVFKVDTQNKLHKHDILTYKGSYGDWKVKTVKPRYLEDNKILFMEFNKSDYKVMASIRKVEQSLDSGKYSFDAISSTKLIPNFPYSIDVLRINQDNSTDFIAFNQEIFNINVSNDVITNVENVDRFTTKNITSYSKSIEDSKVTLDNNLLLALNTESDFQPIKYDSFDGQYMGIAQGFTSQGAVVKLSGFVDNIENVSFTAGENVYYDDLGNLSHDNTGTYIGYATSINSMVARPQYMDYPVISRKYTANTVVNNKMVQINSDNTVNPLPIELQGVSFKDITNSLNTAYTTRKFIKLKDNIIIYAAKNSSSKGIAQILSYNDNNSITALNTETLFTTYNLFNLLDICRINDDSFGIVYSEYDSAGTSKISKFVVGTVDYETNTISYNTPLALDDAYSNTSEIAYLYPISESKILYLYYINSSNGTNTGYLKSQIINYDNISSYLTKNTSITLISDASSMAMGSLLYLDNKFLFCCSNYKKALSKYYISTILFNVDTSTDTITKIIDNNSLEVTSNQDLYCKKIDNSHFTVLYETDTAVNLYLSAATINADNTVTFSLGSLICTNPTTYFLDDYIVNNSIYYTLDYQMYQAVYNYDSSTDSISSYKINKCNIYNTTEPIKVKKVYVLPMNGFGICITADTKYFVKKIYATSSAYGGFYHSEQIYFKGYVTNVGEDILNGVKYYWDKDGNYTVDSNSGKNAPLGIGLNKGIYIFEKSYKLPEDIRYNITCSILPLESIKCSNTETFSISKYLNGAYKDSTYTITIDYMGNSTSMLTISKTTTNSITLKCPSSTYVGKTFTINFLDTNTNITTSQLVTILSIYG